MLEGHLAAECRDKVVSHVAHVGAQAISQLASSPLDRVEVQTGPSNQALLINSVSFLWRHLMQVARPTVFVAAECGLKVEPESQVPLLPFLLLVLHVLCIHPVIYLLRNPLEKLTRCHLTLACLLSVSLRFFHNLVVEEPLGLRIIASFRFIVAVHVLDCSVVVLDVQALVEEGDLEPVHEIVHLRL